MIAISRAGRKGVSAQLTQVSVLCSQTNGTFVDEEVVWKRLENEPQEYSLLETPPGMLGRACRLRRLVSHEDLGKQKRTQTSRDMLNLTDLLRQGR